ncbi:pilus assembly protein PilZ [Stutzerimonas stutzeri]|uniref:Pilus assembly protein PilZ n=1 Tax=Stutzerimonas stutzeri TaxID=316 RepID=W8R677_STUST|nr:flagellar brake protein [Stutzerimonas stutzeri]AHL75023.1 pilus assembly protein PilZ [Stutzerimonas stutzeri]MCQ4331348.1 flagellar brake protein [Stutzerimonas stutzeri]
MSNPFTEDEGPQPPQILKTVGEVHTNLRLLMDNRIPLLVRFAERNQRYQTYLIEVNREKGWIALDELIPSDGERMMTAGEPFQIEGYYEGVRIAWSNEHAAHLGELDDARCYWIPLPDQVIYHQRRNAYRAHLSGQPIVAELNGKAIKKPLEGKVLDMSATGCKLSFQGNVQSGLQTGRVYEQLSARLPFGTITTAAELRHVIFDEKLDLTFCGMRFYRISGLTQRHIERFVYQLQREARRDQASDRFS